jgi:hypothetical protein
LDEMARKHPDLSRVLLIELTLFLLYLLYVQVWFVAKQAVGLSLNNKLLLKRNQVVESPAGLALYPTIALKSLSVTSLFIEERPYVFTMKGIMKKTITLIGLTALSCQMQAQVSFVLSSSPPVGNGASQVVAADVNGDGKLDLVCANQNDNTLSVLTNIGNGSFMLAKNLAVGSGPISVCSADVNGDGKPDLISGNYSANTLTVLTNDGSGNFLVSGTYSTGTHPYSVVAADVNGDGKLDLMCANQGDSTITVLTNNGKGIFALKGTYSVGSGPQSITVADVNGDGKPDLISASYYGNSLTVMTNDGSGGFVLAGTYATSSPYSVVAADVNGDGKPDLICANYGANTLTVLTNNGSGGFITSATLNVGNGPTWVTTADVNGDGMVDLISANQSASTISVYTNSGKGSFALAGTFPAGNGTYSVCAGDINGDGKPDVITGNFYANTLSIFTNATYFGPPSIPIITQQPVGVTNLVGSTTSFNVSVTVTSGPALFNYQWQLSGTNLPAATNNPLVLTNLTLNQAGNYDVIVSDSVGSVTSAPAPLVVQFILVNVNGQPAVGSYSTIAPAIVTLTGGYPGGFLFYTLDGSTPNTSSALYGGPILLTNSVVVSAMGLSSDVSQTNYAPPVTVQITTPAYILQTSVIGNGTVTANPTNSFGFYTSNTVVALTATAGLHWAFDHWTGDATGTSNPVNVTMNGPRNVQAVFVPTAYPLTLSSPGGGKATVNGSVISPATYYPTGSVVTLAATASNGWSFVGWQGSTNSTSNPLSLVINQTNNIEAIFGTIVATNALGGGSIVLSQPNPIPYGTVLTASAVPNYGSFFVTWSGAASGTNAPTTVTVTKTNPIINALFTALPGGKYSLSVAVVGNNGAVTINPQQNYYNPGDNVTLSASTNTGIIFYGWGSDATGTNNPLTVVMNTNLNIQAYFVGAPTVNISPSNVAVLATSNFILNASAYGFAPLGYQWQTANGIIPNATNASYAIASALPGDAGNYTVVVTNAFGSATSAVVTVTVLGYIPVITNQPTPLTTVISGHGASFAVTAGGWPLPVYQWQLNGSNVNGATSPALVLPNAFPANAGNYTVIITNVFGSVTSNPALLIVTPLGLTAPAILTSGQFQFGFDTATGVDYEVEYSTDLINWYPLITVGGIGLPVTLIDPNTTGSSQRFYRIIQSSL